MSLLSAELLSFIQQGLLNQDYVAYCFHFLIDFKKGGETRPSLLESRLRPLAVSKSCLELFA